MPPPSLSAARGPRRAGAGWGAWHIAAFIVVLPVLVCLMLWGAMALSEPSRVRNRVAEWNQGSPSMVCNEGLLDSGGSWWNAMTGTGAVRCTSWSLPPGRGNAAPGLVEWPTSPRR